MRTHFHIFAIASLLCAVLITAILFLGFQTHTNTNVALKLLVKGQTIGLILGLTSVFPRLAQTGEAPDPRERKSMYPAILQ